MLGSNDCHEESILPSHAYLPKIGRVRVLAYKGDGYFEVLDAHDNRRLVRRERLVFIR